MKPPKSLLKWALLLTATAIAIYLCWLDAAAFRRGNRLVDCAGNHFLSRASSSGQEYWTPVIKRLDIDPAGCAGYFDSSGVSTGLAVGELISLKDTLQSKFSEGIDLNEIQPVRRALDWLNYYLDVDPAKAVESIRQHASQLAQMAARYSLTFAGNVTGLIVSFIFTIFTMFFLFRDGERMVVKIPEMLPLERSQSEALVRRIRDVIGGSIYGVVVIALIQGGLGGVMFGILSIPSPVLWGLVMAIASMIPLARSASVWAPGAIYLLATGHWMQAIVLAAFGGVVISSVDNFLRPKLVGERVSLDELVIVLLRAGRLTGVRRSGNRGGSRRLRNCRFPD